MIKIVVTPVVACISRSMKGFNSDLGHTIHPRVETSRASGVNSLIPYLLAIEDLPSENSSSHQDFNDLMVEIQIGQRVVPEPATMLLLGFGCAGLVVRRFKRLK